MSGIYDILMPRVDHPEVEPRQTALVVIDMQYLDAHRDFGFGRRLAEHGALHLAEEFFTRLDDVVPRQVELLEAARAAGVQVVFVRIKALRHDGADANLHYRTWGVPPEPGSREEDILDELAPLAGDVVVDKVATSAFNGSQIDAVLRNLGICKLLVCGVNTNNCVEMTARDATDRGYWVEVVSDACAALAGDAAHASALERLDFGLSRVRSSAQVVAELSASSPSTDPQRGA